MLDYRDFDDFRDFVFESMLEKPGALKDVYDSFHDNDGTVKEEDIEWFRKRYTKRRSPCYSFIFIAKGEFFVHYLVYGFDDDLDVGELAEYGMDNWRGYVDEFYGGDESSAPVFRYAVIVIAGDKDIKKLKK